MLLEAVGDLLTLQPQVTRLLEALQDCVRIEVRESDVRPHECQVQGLEGARVFSGSRGMRRKNEKKVKTTCRKPTRYSRVLRGYKIKKFCIQIETHSD